MGDDISCVELDKHGGIRFEVFDRDSKPEVVEDEELELEMIQLGKGQTSDLARNVWLAFGVSRQYQGTQASSQSLGPVAE